MLPVKKPAAKVQERHLDYIYVRCEGYTAIRKRGKGDIWQGLYEPLASEYYILQGSAKNQFSEAGVTLLRKGVRHQLTHRLIVADFYLWEPEHRPELPEGYFWIKETELDRYAKPRLFELLLEALT